MKDFSIPQLPKINRRHATLAIAASAFAGLDAFAQSSGPIRCIVATGPGSNSDTTIRSMAPGLNAILGQPLVIENQPAAGGVPGTRTVALAPPDGRTIGMVSNSYASNPIVYKDIGFDFFKDAMPISIISKGALYLIVNPKKLPVTNLAEMTAALKAKPKAYNHGSSGNGTGLHLAAEMYLDQAGVHSTHVPYKSAAPFVADLISGQVDWGCSALSPVLGQLKTGNLRAIAVFSKTRIAEYPEAATSVEQGMPDLIFESWNAAICPAKLPAAELKRLYDAFLAVSANADVREAIKRAGSTVALLTPEESAAYVRSEYEKFSALAKKIKFVAN